jgi:hypothetical protein
MMLQSGVEMVSSLPKAVADAPAIVLAASAAMCAVLLCAALVTAVTADDFAGESASLSEESLLLWICFTIAQRCGVVKRPLRRPRAKSIP